jgi:NADPH-dependent 7-cyano-7-deazaguanine reductase QueF
MNLAGHKFDSHLLRSMGTATWQPVFLDERIQIRYLSDFIKMVNLIIIKYHVNSKNKISGSNNDCYFNVAWDQVLDDHFKKYILHFKKYIFL